MNNSAVKNGLFAGLVYIVFSMTTYLAGPDILFGPISYLGLLIPFVFMYRATAEQKAENEGYLTFKEAFSASFLVLVIAFLFSNLFSYILINFIDTGLADVIKERSIEMIDMLEEFLEEDQLEEMKDQLEDQNFTPTITKTLSGYLASLVFPGSLIALIMAAFTKKNKPNNDFA